MSLFCHHLNNYIHQDLECAISDYLRAVLSIRNVCLIYDTAALYQLASLVASCAVFMDRHAAKVIRHESFNTLTAVIRRASSIGNRK